MIVGNRDLPERSLTYKLCRGCGLVFQSPRMTEEDLQAYYENDYRAAHADADIFDRELAVQQQRAEHLGELVPRTGRIDSHLDIGCSSGALLGSVQARLGDVRSVGVELDPVFRSHAVERGHEVYATLDEAMQQIDRFDLVTMSHVLEHIYDPLEYLRRLRREVVGEAGYLLLEVPNVFGHDSFENAHAFAFSPSVLRRLLEAGAFSVERLIAHARPTSAPRRPVYLTALARPGRERGYRRRPLPSAVFHVRRAWGLSDRSSRRTLSYLKRFGDDR